MDQQEKTIHERGAPRLAVNLPAAFIGTDGSFRCIISDVSRTGALIAINPTLAVNSEGYIRSAPIDRFVTVVREERGLNAIEFDIPLTDLFVADLRRYRETFDYHERQRLAEAVRSWTTGENLGRF